MRGDEHGARASNGLAFVDAGSLAHCLFGARFRGVFTGARNKEHFAGAEATSFDRVVVPGDPSCLEGGP